MHNSEKVGPDCALLCLYAHVVLGSYPQLKIQDIGFSAQELVNSIIDTNKCALVYIPFAINIT